MSTLAKIGVGLAIGVPVATGTRLQLSLGPSEPETYPDFSFITLTPVGYGNQIPTATLSARIAVILAIIGQIFLATFVARLVSLYGRSRPTTEPRADN